LVDVLQQRGCNVDQVEDFVAAQIQDAGVSAFDGRDSFFFHPYDPIPSDRLILFKGIYRMREVLVADRQKVIVFLSLCRSERRKSIFIEPRALSLRKGASVTNQDGCGKRVPKRMSFLCSL
jgi:hypothetical protein